MLLNPRDLATNLDRLEEIERASLRLVHQVRAGTPVREEGKLDKVLSLGGESYLTVTLFVKYNYEDIKDKHVVQTITAAALPNGFLQDRYNPDLQDTIWLAGRNAPTRGEEFRVRLSLARLKQKANWRVQRILMPPQSFRWDP